MMRYAVKEIAKVIAKAIVVAVLIMAALLVSAIMYNVFAYFTNTGTGV